MKTALKWVGGTQVNYAFLIVVAGHPGSGKDDLKDLLMGRISSEGVPIEHSVNHKDRRLRSNEIRGESFEPWPVAPLPHPPIVWERAGDKYGINQKVVDSLRENLVHQIIMADIMAIPEIRNYLLRQELPNRMIPIGLYVDQAEAEKRLIQRAPLTEDHMRSVYRQMQNLPELIAQYRKSHALFRYLFHNPPPKSTLDVIVERSMDLLAREARDYEKDDTAFRNRYINDIVRVLFGTSIEYLEVRSSDVRLHFDRRDFDRHAEVYGSSVSITPGNLESVEDIRNARHAQSIADKIGYPIAIKVSGSTERGRVVSNETELKKNYGAIQATAESEGSSVYIEKVVPESILGHTDEAYGILSAVANSKIVATKRAYGILNVFLYLPTPPTFTNTDLAQHRGVLQELLQVKIGFPQRINEEDGVTYRSYSPEGLVTSRASRFMPVASYSPFDSFPLVARSAIDERAPPHTLMIHFLETKDRAVIEAVTRDKLPAYMAARGF